MRNFLGFLGDFKWGGSPDKTNFLRGDGTWATTPGEFIVPSSINKVAGGTATGSVTDVQTLLDGNSYQVVEAAATPGFDIEFTFTNINSIAGFVSHIWYDGGAAGHDVTLRLYNDTDTQDDPFLVIPSSGLYAYRTVLIPDDSKYINSSNEVDVVLYHDSGGSVAHDVYIDYIALIGTTV